MRLGIIVPCYNEEEVLAETANRLLQLIIGLIDSSKIDERSKIYFVDDGSSDATWSIIDGLCHNNTLFAGIKLSRNYGHQNALLSGLFTADEDALVSVDADLQDDIRIIEQMVDARLKGADIVYGVRRSRDTDTHFKRITGELFYRMMKIMGVNIVFNHADFRLMSRRSIEALKEFREVNVFLRGLVPLIGFPTTTVHYDRAERFAGESKYPLKAMITFALEGITSFSVSPLRMITAIGLTIFIFSMIMTSYILLVRLFTSSAIPGWASTVLPVYLLGGIQLFCTGIIGEYLGKIYKEIKSRPRYLIEREVNVSE